MVLIMIIVRWDWVGGGSWDVLNNKVNVIKTCVQVDGPIWLRLFSSLSYHKVRGESKLVGLCSTSSISGCLCKHLCTVVYIVVSAANIDHCSITLFISLRICSNRIICCACGCPG